MKKNIFIIAELSANHNGSIETAIQTIKAAKRTGADAIKLQTYTADTITLNVKKNDFKINGTIWNGQYLYDLYQQAYTPWEWHAELFKVAKEEGLICFSSPFDFSAVDLLETLDCPIYKIASFEITDIPLIKYVASKGKPIILSTGIAEFDDIALAIKTCRDVGNNEITLLKCTSSYPAPIAEANLTMIKQYAKDFNVAVGLSDHTLGCDLPAISVFLGAEVIEKHFILNHDIGGPDASFSLDEKQFTQMVLAVRNAEKQLSEFGSEIALKNCLANDSVRQSAIGTASYQLTEKQQASKAFARSLYVSTDVKKGDVVTTLNLRSVRPGFGLHPKFFEELLGSTFNQDVEKGSRMDFSLLNK